jgi:polysaccharide pyruvyl transferase WcaK-like protein
MSYPYTLMKWSVVARLRGTKLFFISVGAGPIYANLSKRFIKIALSLATYRSFRDDFSKELLQSIGFDKDDPIYPDLVHAMQLPPPSPANRPKTAKIVGIGPMGYFKEECWPEGNKEYYADYLAKMAAFIQFLIEKGYRIMYITGELFFDQLVISDLIEELERHLPPNSKDLFSRPKLESLPDLLENIEKTDFIVASRFHNVLLGQKAGKPVLAISYQEKIDALMNDTGQGEYVEQIGEFTVDALRKKFQSMEDNYDLIVKQALQKHETYSRLLQEQFTRVFKIIG